jgi:spoIIIJ-associated protein
MIKVEANTLEEAYSKASAELDCSITELNFEVIQQPSKGFLGIFKKSAVIVATCKMGTKKPIRLKNDTPKKTKRVHSPKKEPIEEKSIDKKVAKEKESPSSDKSSSGQDIFDNFYSTPTKPIQTEHPAPTKQTKEYPTQKPKRHPRVAKRVEVNINHTILTQIKNSIQNLIDLSCYSINKLEISQYDEFTVLIEVDGDDAALLIGKDGYRYKAISYILFNWLNPKYGVSVRLEIAQFLSNQEDMIYSYIDTLYEKISSQSRVQTKPLDGILLHIALNRLRELYPDKYVGIKVKNDKRFVVINDFN